MSAIMRFFEIDLANVGGPTLYFHPGLNEHGGPVIWTRPNEDDTMTTVQYDPFPMEIDGLEIDGQGRLPRPTLTVSNIEGRLGALVRLYKDLNGCVMTMRTTLSDYIDACNFKDGENPLASPGLEMPKEIFIFERKAEETLEYVKFDLSSALDLEGQMLPKRCFYTNYCPHEFGGPLCGAGGGGGASAGACDHTLTGCEAHHGKGAPLPFGGFPGASAVGM